MPGWPTLSPTSKEHLVKKEMIQSIGERISMKFDLGLLGAFVFKSVARPADPRHLSTQGRGILEILFEKLTVELEVQGTESEVQLERMVEAKLEEQGCVRVSRFLRLPHTETFDFGDEKYRILAESNDGYWVRIAICTKDGSPAGYEGQFKMSDRTSVEDEWGIDPLRYLIYRLKEKFFADRGKTK